MSWLTMEFSDASAILTFTGTYAPRSGSLWLSDVSHHHLALGIVALLLSHMLSVASLPRMPISSVHFDLADGPYPYLPTLSPSLALVTGGVQPVEPDWSVRGFDA